MLKTLLVAGAVAASAMPALASEYYVVRGENEKTCRVVESRPSDTTIVQVGPLAFATRDEAEREVTVLCKSDNDDDDNNGAQVIIKKD